MSSYPPPSNRIFNEYPPPPPPSAPNGSAGNYGVYGPTGGFYPPPYDYYGHYPSPPPPPPPGYNGYSTPVFFFHLFLLFSFLTHILEATHVILLPNSKTYFIHFYHFLTRTFLFILPFHFLFNNNSYCFYLNIIIYLQIFKLTTNLLMICMN